MILTIALLVLAVAVLYAIVKGVYMASYLKKNGITQEYLREHRISANKMYKRMRTQKTPNP